MLLEMKNIVKTYGNVVANNKVNINLNKGENTIEFVIKTNTSRYGSNFMAMNLISATKLS